MVEAIPDLRVVRSLSPDVGSGQRRIHPARVRGIVFVHRWAFRWAASRTWITLSVLRWHLPSLPSSWGVGKKRVTSGKRGSRDRLRAPIGVSVRTLSSAANEIGEALARSKVRYTVQSESLDRRPGRCPLPFAGQLILRVASLDASRPSRVEPRTPVRFRGSGTDGASWCHSLVSRQGKSPRRLRRCGIGYQPACDGCARLRGDLVR